MTGGVVIHNVNERWAKLAPFGDENGYAVSGGDEKRRVVEALQDVSGLIASQASQWHSASTSSTS